MSLHRRNPRRDRNETAIVQTLRWAGWSVLRLSIPGAPDLLLGRGERLVLAEIKVPGATLRPNQRLWHADWRGPKPLLLRSVEDALEISKSFRSESDE